MLSLCAYSDLYDATLILRTSTSGSGVSGVDVESLWFEYFDRKKKTNID